jgi:hypothetical protein
MRRCFEFERQGERETHRHAPIEEFGERETSRDGKLYSFIVTIHPKLLQADEIVLRSGKEVANGTDPFWSVLGYEL